MSGLLAEFVSEAALAQAATHLRGQAVGAVETYTPAAIANEPRSSVLPAVILAAGLLGAAGAFTIQVYATGYSYPLNIGGRPNFGWPAFIPMMFEIGVLCAVMAGLLGFLIANRMPALYDPVDEADSFRRATRDGYFLTVRNEDGAAIGRARAMLDGLRPLHVAAIAE